MNLFVTDECPIKSAQALDDKRVGKLLMEANQMLSLAVKMADPASVAGWMEGDGMLTRGFAHKNHPVSVWVRQTSRNFGWCLRHAIALGEEWTHRFGTAHASAARTPYIQSFEHCLEIGRLLPFQNSARHETLGIDYSHLPVPLSYRCYLANRWQSDTMPVKFTNRGAPEWLSSMQ